VADGRRSSIRRADRDVADLAIGRQITEQDEVAERVADRLLVQPGLEHAHIELRRRRGIRHDDVEVLESQILERQRGRRLGPRRRHASGARSGAHRGEKRSP
jgi:hypothetical protein